MPNIKVQVQPWASEQTVSEIVSAANAATSASVAPKAEVIRDANGKVVMVNVNLPTGIAQNDLENAANKITENHGVATAQAFPIIKNSFLDTGYSDGDVIVQATGTGNNQLNSVMLDIGGGIQAELDSLNSIVTATSDAALSQGVAMKHQVKSDIQTFSFLGQGPNGFTNYTCRSGRAELFAYAGSFNLPSFGACKIGASFKLNLHEFVVDGAECRALLSGPGGCSVFFTHGADNKVVANFNVGTTTPIVVATTIAADGSEYFYAEIDHDKRGVSTLKINSVAVADYDHGFVQESGMMSASLSGKFLSSLDTSLYLQKMDDFQITISS